MTCAADSAATLAPQAECEAAQTEREGSGDEFGATSGHLPVFVAFDDLGLTGRDIAQLIGVTPPTVSKWRSAKVRIPGDKLAFLTLVLAHLLDEADKVADVSPGGQSENRGLIASAHAALAYQDVLNRDLDPSDVHVGAQRFRTWWSSGEAQKLQDKHFQPPSSAEILDVLKKMRTQR